MYEIIHLEADELSSSGTLLGFDVGYWSDEHFSLIADVAVMPRWHPPPPDAFGAVADALARLNEHVLFPTASDAAAFLDYRSQDWAETGYEPGEFAIIRVCDAAPAA